MKYAFGIYVLLPVLLAIPLWITVGGSGGHFVDFIHAPSAFAFLIVIAGVLFITGGFKTFVRMCNALFSKKYVLSAEDREKCVNLLGLLIKVVNITAVFNIVGSVIALMLVLDDLANLGPMLSYALLTALYAAAINLIFIMPAIHILKNRRAHDEKTVINEKVVVNKMLELCYKQGISPEEILEASEINFRK